MDIVLRIDKNDKELITGIEQVGLFEAEVMEGAGFDGHNDLVTVLLSVTTSTLTTLVAVLKSKWNRNKPVSIEVDGMKVAGADPEEVEKLLKQMLEARQKDKPGE